ncbi:hypothetical protein ES703_95900 [subsurface metagenome]
MSWVSRLLLAGGIRLVFIYNRIEQLRIIRSFGKYTYTIERTYACIVIAQIAAYDVIGYPIANLLRAGQCY